MPFEPDLDAVQRIDTEGDDSPTAQRFVEAVVERESDYYLPSAEQSLILGVPRNDREAPAALIQAAFNHVSY